jgi:hypothetical protein
MMTDEQRSKVARLKAAITASEGVAGGIPLEVREAVLELKRELGAEGMTARMLAAMLGVHETTLCRWGRADGAGTTVGVRRRAKRMASEAKGPRREAAGFRMVQIGAQVKPAQHPSPASRGLRVAHAPSGLVVDGLDVEMLAALLRRLS